MTDTVVLAILAAIPATIVSVTAMVVAIIQAARLGKVTASVDGIVSARVAAEHDLGVAKGHLQEIAEPTASATPILYGRRAGDVPAVETEIRERS